MYILSIPGHRSLLHWGVDSLSLRSATYGRLAISSRGPRRLGPAGCHAGAESVEKVVGESYGGGGIRRGAHARAEQRGATVEAGRVLHQDARVPDGRRRRDRSRVVEEEGDVLYHRQGLSL